MSRILRIGIIQAGKFTEERLIRSRHSVTIGASTRNTIALPWANLPPTLKLFAMCKGTYRLRYSEGMRGRIALNQGQVMNLAEAAPGQAQGSGRRLELPLTEEARGKIVLGDVTILFQFVTPPPAAPSPQLPASVRGGVFSNVDWGLACSFITMAVLQFSFLTYVHAMEPPPRIRPDEIAAATQRYIPIYKLPLVPDLKKLSELGEKAIKKEPAPASGEEAGRSKKRVKKSPPRPCDQACEQAKAAKRQARLSRQIASTLKTMVIGSKGSGSGAVADLINGADPGRAVAKAFSGMGGVALANNGKTNGLASKGESGEGEVLSAGQLGLVGPGKVRTGEMVKERVPTAQVTPARPDVVNGKMSTSSTIRVVRRAMRCVKAQYQRGLKADPRLEGKVSYCMSVNSMGQVRSVDLETDSMGAPLVTSGIAGCLKRLRFPPPQGGSAEVCVPFLLQPSE